MSKYHKNLNENQIKLMEKLADIEHQRWASWQKYMHSKGMKDEFGSLTIQWQEIERWEKQIKTDYKDLSEAEKDSDREQVLRYFNLIN